MNGDIKKTVLFIVLPLIILGAVVYHVNPGNILNCCGLSAKPEAITVQLKWLHNAQFTGIYSAQENNYYKKNGLNITILERDLKKGTVSSLIASGKADIGITSPIDLIRAIDEGKKIKAVAVIYQESPAAIVSLTETNINSPSDLKGKKLGIPADTNESKLFYKILLNKFKIDESDVEFVITKNLVDDLINHKIDAASFYRTNETYKLSQMNVSFSAIHPEYQGIETYDDVIIASDTLINEHPEKVQEFIDATIDGWIWSFENKDEALKFVSKYDTGEYNSPEREQHILSTSEPLIAWNGYTQIGKMTDKKWDKLLDVLNEQKVLNSKINSKNIYTNQFIN